MLSNITLEAYDWLDYLVEMMWIDLVALLVNSKPGLIGMYDLGGPTNVHPLVPIVIIRLNSIAYNALWLWHCVLMGI